jgi:hypothetical protein
MQQFMYSVAGILNCVLLAVLFCSVGCRLQHYARYDECPDVAIIVRPFRGTSTLETNVPSGFITVTNRIDKRVVFLSGEIRNPGYCEWREGLLASELVKAGGGGTPFADLSRVHICRRGGIDVVVDLRPEILPKAVDVKLKPGDVVRVLRRF